MELSELYRQVILEHARSPHNAMALEEADVTVSLANRLCGDDLELTLQLDQDQIRAVGLRARGCAILQASSSLMSDLIRGRTLECSQELGVQLKTLLEGGAVENPDLEPLLPLLSLKDHRNRHRCVLLPWEALAEAAQQLASEKRAES